MVIDTRQRQQKYLHRGFTLIELLFTILIIGIILNIAIPSFIRSRTSAHRSACLKNLNAIENAKDQWAVENHKIPGAMVSESDLIGASNFLTAMPTCPAGGSYTMNAIGTFADCDYDDHTL
jgi:prepilin-type N-terminal cleavage/methylation domain-containing protein